jgi:hypothetical protein
VERYILRVEKNKKKRQLCVIANNANHANAQAIDIARSLQADVSTLTYGQINICELSLFFKKLAYSEFDRKNCFLWQGKYCNNTPIIYALGTKYYIRPLILSYLDIPKDSFVLPKCKKKNCINPFHNTYKNMKASKLTSADRRLALAFASQGTPIKDIAKAFKVHRSSIYRLLNQ